MSGARPRVAIILVNWNGWRDCVECLDALLAQDYEPFHVFLVDNDSKDQSLDHIAQWCAAPQRDVQWSRIEGANSLTAAASGAGHACAPVAMRRFDAPAGDLPCAPENVRLTLMQSGANLGFAGGNNVGLRAAGTTNFDFYWLLNTDTVVDRQALSMLVQRAVQADRPGIVGATLRYYSNPGLVQAMGGGRINELTTSVSHIGDGVPIGDVPQDASAIERETAYVVGASMLVSRDFLQQIGLMQEDYFLYFEEIDWAMRARGRFKMAYAPKSFVYHKVGASSAKVVSVFSLNLLYRNRIRFASRFFPQRLSATKRHLAWEMFRYVIKGQWRRAKPIARVLLDAPKLVVDRQGAPQ